MATVELYGVENTYLGDLGATRESLHSVGQVMGASGSFPYTSMVGLCCDLQQAFLKYDLMICIRGLLFLGGGERGEGKDKPGPSISTGIPADRVTGIDRPLYTGLHTLWEGT